MINCRKPSGGVIDRSTALRFMFDGISYTGHPGDTLASALLANGVHLVGRSFKYHRPRGILTAGSEEPNGLVELRRGAAREPNTRATVAELYDGLEARSQNRWPSLKYDALAVNSLAAPMLVAGFYYKTFMWPAPFWERMYEPLIRRAAGLGRAALEPDPDNYEKITAHCDVLVVGGGPAGLSAALVAARSCARVILADEGFQLGGQSVAASEPIDDRPVSDWITAAEAELHSFANVRILRRTTVFGVYDSGTYGAVERVSDHLPAPPQGVPRQRLWRIVARQAILASGATERPIAFGNNDLPGIMLAGAVRTYLDRYAVRPGRTAVVFTNNSSAASTIAAMHRGDVRVAAVVDARPQSDASITVAARAAGAPLLAGAEIIDASGGRKLAALSVRLSDGRVQKLTCDLLAVSGGWNPNLQLTTHLGGRPVWSDRTAAFVPDQLPPGMLTAGGVAGRHGLADAIADGASSAVRAAKHCGFSVAPAAPSSGRPEDYQIAPVWRVVSGKGKGKAFVDFQNDVTAQDIEIANREGFGAIEHLKRYTTLGMATDQGKTSGVVGMGVLAEQTGRTLAETGVTVMRPPYTPVAIGVLAGHHRGPDFKPKRLPPSYEWAREQGAVFVETGLWMRPQYFPKPGDKDWLDAAVREVNGVRTAVGVCDVSTLGKIDIQGADAAAFLDRVYANTFSTLPISRARYGIMLREDGFVLDDGTTARFGPHHFVMTTTTANAARVMMHLEYCHQWLWPQLDVRMVAVTDQWAQYAVAGPRSRELLERIADAGRDLSNTAFPYMSAAAITVCNGIDARLFRLSFSGELAYELAVPARYGDDLIRRLMAAGAPLGVVAYGSEALGIMRIEKGHAAGAELNGTTTASDLGLGGLLSTKKDCIGRVLSGRPALTAADRPVLVGIKPHDISQQLRSGAHMVPEGAAATAENDEGYVTSVAYSPTLGHWIGLALLKRGRERHGERVIAASPIHSESVLVEIVSPVFVDQEGARLRG
ncbi:MAG: sarcosine oxidase subunit alpha [Hyphomicrobium sp.]|nr:MAG: sarcosine oxidase subunit alpha [Hyphomicrobium sp.]